MKRQGIDSDSSQMPVRQTNDDHKWDSIERPSIRSRGLATPDPFSSRDDIHQLEFNGPLHEEELRTLGFEKTQGGVQFRRVNVKDSLVGVEVKIGAKVIGAKTGYEYLSEGLRTVGIDMRNMLTDLNELSKLLSKTEFEETKYFA